MKKGTGKRKTVTQKIQDGIRKIRVARKVSARKSRTSNTQTKKKAAAVTKGNSRVVKIEAPTMNVGAVNTALKEKVRVTKFSPTQTAMQDLLQQPLPFRYYDDRIVIMARDPWWLHSYWDISQNKIESVISQIPQDEREGLIWILRVYDVTGVRDFNGSIQANFQFDMTVNFEANNWYINVQKPERQWCVEIGFKSNKGNFYPVARSNIIKTPYFGISDKVDEEWALPDDEYTKIFGAYDLGRSSFERKKRLHQQLLRQISSGVSSGQVSSLFSMREQAGQRKFFMEVWTELILYGRTEATAQVTVCGEKIKLRDDGTFSFRYALPEGNFRYDVVATSEDGVDTIKKIPAVTRYTIK